MAVQCLGKVSYTPMQAAEVKARCVNIAEPYFPHSSCLWAKYQLSVGWARQASRAILRCCGSLQAAAPGLSPAPLLCRCRAAELCPRRKTGVIIIAEIR